MLVTYILYTSPGKVTDLIVNVDCLDGKMTRAAIINNLTSFPKKQYPTPSRAGSENRQKFRSKIFKILEGPISLN